MKTSTSTYLRLSVMMLFAYGIWGSWLPVIARYLATPPQAGGLGFSGYQIGMIMGLAGSFGAFTSPFIAGQLADRHIRTEHCLAVMMLIASVIKWITAHQTSYTAWLILSVIYSVVAMPSTPLSNSIAFAHLEDREREFPMVRIWATLGWAAAGWIFPMIWLQTDLQLTWMPPFLVGPEVPDATARLVDSLKFSAIISLALAVQSLFFLPKTLPRSDAEEKLAFAKAFGMLKRNRSFLVLTAISLPLAVINQIYWLQTAPYLFSLGVQGSLIGPAMTIGQLGEVLMMALLGGALKRLGFRLVMFIGAMGYVARYAIFGTMSLPLPLIVASQAFHGVCFAFFFAAAFIYIDKLADKDVRHSVQTVYTIIWLGGGPVLAGVLSGFLQERFSVPGGFTDFSKLWYSLVPIALVSAAAFYLGFRDETGAEATAPAAAPLGAPVAKS